jgi:hypothetical protein
MGTVANSLAGISYLMQSGGPLAGLSAQLTPAQLQSAPSKDVVDLSMAALRTQEVDGLLGIAPASQTTLPAVPIASAPASATSASPTSVLPGVASADLASATPQEQSSINDQALALQQAQGLFAAPASTTGSTDVLA